MPFLSGQEGHRGAGRFPLAGIAAFPPSSHSSATMSDEFQSVTRFSLASSSGNSRKAQENPDVTQLLVQEKIKQLEEVSGEPERRELAKLRRKLLKEVANFIADKNNSLEDKITYLQQKITSLVSEQGMLEAEIVPLRRKTAAQTTTITTTKEDADRATLRSLKLEALCRSLQSKNMQLVEEGDARNKMIQKFSGELDNLSSKIAAQDNAQSQVAVENIKLQEQIAIMIEQGKLKDDLHAKQLHAKELDVKVAEAQGAAHLHTVAELQAALEASRQAEAAMRSHVAQLHQRMEEVQETIFKTTEAIKLSNEHDKKRAAQAKAYEKQIHKRDKEIGSMKEHMQMASTALQDLQIANAALKNQKEALENLARALQAEVRSLKAAQPEASSSTASRSSEAGIRNSGGDHCEKGVPDEAREQTTSTSPTRGSCEEPANAEPAPMSCSTPSPVQAGVVPIPADVPGQSCDSGDMIKPPVALAAAEGGSASSVMHLNQDVDSEPIQVTDAQMTRRIAEPEEVLSVPPFSAPSSNPLHSREDSPGPNPPAEALSPSSSQPLQESTHGWELSRSNFGESAPVMTITSQTLEVDRREVLASGVGSTEGGLHQREGDRVGGRSSNTLLDQGSQCAVDVLTSAFGDSLDLQAACRHGIA